MTNHKSFQSYLEEITEAFSSPSFYAHKVSKIDRRETHISVVFLTGEWVYKIKKPVDFGFLNYTTLDLRKHYCRREVELNKRLSDNIYSDVVAICRDKEKGNLFLGDCERPLEYAVRMREIPEETCFRSLLDKEAVTKNEVRAIAERLAGFYRSGSISNPLLALYGGVEYVRFNAYENFRQLEPFALEIGGKNLLNRMKYDTYKFTVLFKDLFRERLELGFIKDGHGDLRADHIYFYNGVQVIDCIEFNNRFRYGDVAADLSFLFMDLMRLGHEDWAYVVIEEYSRASGDLQLWFLLDFYTAYRAAVRAKVACLETFSHAEDVEKNKACFNEAKKFMKLGATHTFSYSVPTVWIFMGPPASGKSRLGREMARKGHIGYLASDRIRRKLFPEAGRSPFGHGVYSKEAREIVYRKLAEETVEFLKRRRSLVVDATFALEGWRKAFIDTISVCEAHVLFIETMAERDVIEKRLMSREHSQDTMESDARIEHFAKFMATYESPDEIKGDMLVKVDTGKMNEFESLLKILSEGIRKRTFQASDRISKEDL